MSADRKTTPMTAPVLVRREGPVTWLTLNRPYTANTVDLGLATALRDALTDIEATPTRIIVIEANGRVFCGGGDVDAIGGAGNVSRYLAELAATFNQVLGLLANSRSIVIAAVNGAAAGAGLGIVLNADLVIATPRARFLSAFAGVGLTPDSGVSYLLPRSVGMHRALSLSLTGRVLDAETALQWGLVAEVVTEEALPGHVGGLAARLGTGGGEFLGETKRLMRSSGLVPYPQHQDDEARTIAAMAQHPDTLALLNAFAGRNK